MAEFQYELKIFLEAEDVSQSRIMSSYSSVKAMLEESPNAYLKSMKIENESDMDEFFLRLYIQKEETEEKCSDAESAKGFLDDAAELLAEIAHAHSFLDMEGILKAEYQGEKEAYTFHAESGSAFCEFEETEF